MGKHLVDNRGQVDRVAYITSDPTLLFILRSTDIHWDRRDESRHFINCSRLPVSRRLDDGPAVCVPLAVTQLNIIQERFVRIPLILAFPRLYGVWR